MSTTFDAMAAKLKTACDAALAYRDFAAAEAVKAAATVLDANWLTENAIADNIISQRDQEDAFKLVHAKANADSDTVACNPLAIRYVRVVVMAEEANGWACNNLYLATKRLESAIAAYNTHVNRKYDEKVDTVTLNGENGVVEPV